MSVEVKNLLDSMLRVNLIGEKSAVTICKNQLHHSQDAELKEELAHMLEQEEGHRDYFIDIASDLQIRPTFFEPLWNIYCTGLGMATAFLGKEAVMASIRGIEEVIEQHYGEQLKLIDQAIENCDENDENEPTASAGNHSVKSKNKSRLPKGEGVSPNSANHKISASLQDIGSAAPDLNNSKAFLTAFREKIEQFRQDESGHKDTAGETFNTFAGKASYFLAKTSTTLAVMISKKI